MKFVKENLKIKKKILLGDEIKITIKMAFNKSRGNWSLYYKKRKKWYFKEWRLGLSNLFIYIFSSSETIFLLLFFFIYFY